MPLGNCLLGSSDEAIPTPLTAAGLLRRELRPGAPPRAYRQVAIPEGRKFRSRPVPCRAGGFCWCRRFSSTPGPTWPRTSRGGWGHAASRRDAVWCCGHFSGGKSCMHRPLVHPPSQRRYMGRRYLPQTKLMPPEPPHDARRSGRSNTQHGRTGLAAARLAPRAPSRQRPSPMCQGRKEHRRDRVLASTQDRVRVDGRCVVLRCVGCAALAGAV